MYYRLWEVNNYPEEQIISKTRIDRGVFDSYDGAVEFAKSLHAGKLTSWEIDLVHTTN